MRYLTTFLLTLAFFAAPAPADAADILCLPDASGECTFHARVGEPDWVSTNLRMTQTICARLNGIDLNCATPDPATGMVLFAILIDEPGMESQVFGVAFDASGNESPLSADDFLRDQKDPPAPPLVP